MSIRNLKLLTMVIFLLFVGTSLNFVSIPANSNINKMTDSTHSATNSLTLNGLHIELSPKQSFEYTGQVFHIFVNSTTGYTNYSAVLYLSANDVSGMSPSHSVLKKSKIGYFEFNITAPEQANQTVYGLVVVKASFEGSPVCASTSFTTSIYNPITLCGYILNTGSVTYYNVPIGFYINGGSILGTVYVKALEPFKREKVNITISSSLLVSGTNTLQIEVITNSTNSYSGVDKFTDTFYYGTPPNYSWFYYIAGIVVVFMIFLTVTSASRRGTKQPKWRTRKSKDKKLTKK